MVPSSEQMMERIMPSNCAHINTHSKSSVVVETIEEGMKSLPLYQQYQTTSIKQKGYTFEKSFHAHWHNSVSQHLGP